MQSAQHLLENTFGYQSFRLNQQKIVESLLAGSDVLALMPTGGGKSICYQIPALIRAGTGIVISPLIALMQDQVDALAQLGIKAAFLNSTLSFSEAREIEQRLLKGEIDILYVAPERIVLPQCLNLLSQIQVSLFAIDEAHCVSQWGHDFRPDYQQLTILYQRFPNVPRIALTATADSRTRQEIVNQLNLQNVVTYVNSFDRPNIQYMINDGQNSRDKLWQFIQQAHSKDAGIVYCLSRKKVESVAEWLNKKGRVALPYHAGLKAEVRHDHQQRFLREPGIIVVATIAFGMGIDKPDVRFVAHLSLPKSIEAYYQETGRAGRDGAPATAWMAYGLQDVITLRQMMQQSNADQSYKLVSQQKLEAMLGLCELTSCRRQSILAYFGEEGAQPCGNCDNCIKPPEPWDATVVAQKALSCIYRTGQRFGVAYVTDVLLGKEEQRIISNGHNRLSTFGVGAELTVAQWRSLFRQLIAQGYITVDHDHYGALKLNEKSRPLLKGSETLLARKLSKQAATKQAGSRQTGNKQVSTIHMPLLDALKTLRRELANTQGLPPYVIFHDATLLQMVEKRPTRLSDLQYISGVGEKKLAQYGEDFLMVIKAYPLPEMYDKNLSDTVNESLLLVSQGKAVAEIAELRGLKEGTIYSHMADGIAAGLIDPMAVLPIDGSDYELIVQAIASLTHETGSLKLVYEALDEVYSYDVLRCVFAAESLCTQVAC